MMIMLSLAPRRAYGWMMATRWLSICMSHRRRAVSTAPITCSTPLLSRLFNGQDKRLVLEVNGSNVRAGRSYRASRFVETGRRRIMGRDPAITEIELGYPLIN
jgi:hypothetical protein